MSATKRLTVRNISRWLALLGLLASPAPLSAEEITEEGEKWVVTQLSPSEILQRFPDRGRRSRIFVKATTPRGAGETRFLLGDIGWNGRLGNYACRAWGVVVSDPRGHDYYMETTVSCRHGELVVEDVGLCPVFSSVLGNQKRTVDLFRLHPPGERRTPQNSVGYAPEQQVTISVECE